MYVFYRFIQSNISLFLSLSHFQFIMEDEFGELYADILPRPPFSQTLDIKLNINNSISSENEEKIVNCSNNLSLGDMKLGKICKAESLIEETENKDFSFNIVSQYNNDVAYEDYEQKENKKMGDDSNSIRVDKNYDFNFVKLEKLDKELVDDQKLGAENELKKGIGNDNLVQSKAFVLEIKDCDSHKDMDAGISASNLETHPLVLELMNSTSFDDVSGDEINLNVLKIASDCGIGVEKDDDIDGESDSENGFDLIMTDVEFSRRVKDKGKEICESGILSNATVLATPYDDDESDNLEGNRIGIRGSCEDVLHTQPNFVLPSHQTIFDVNIDELKEKRWRFPGVDPTDFFNFGFNELGWKNYCNKMKIDKKPLSTSATSASNRSLQAETFFTKMDAMNGNSQEKVAEDTYEQPTIPIGEAIQVKISTAQRFPSVESKTPPHSDTVIEIIIQDDNSDNGENDDVKYVAEVDLDAIRPLPIDSPYEFLLAYGQLPCPVDEERFSMFRGSSKGGWVEAVDLPDQENFCEISRKKEKQDRAEGTSARPNNLRPTRSRKPIPTYPPKKELKSESWKKHLTDLIRKYGKDNNKEDDRRPNKTIHTRINTRTNIPEGSRTKKRYETCILGPRRSVQSIISNTHINLHYEETEKKWPRGPFAGNRREIWSGKRLCKNDSGSESDSHGREEGEIIENERRDLKRKSIHCRINYCADKAIRENSCQKARKHPLSRLTY